MYISSRKKIFQIRAALLKMFIMTTLVIKLIDYLFLHLMLKDGVQAAEVENFDVKPEKNLELI